MSNVDPAISPGIRPDSAQPSPPAVDASSEPGPHRGGRTASWVRSATGWFDNTTKQYTEAETAEPYAVDWLRMIPFAGLHLMCFGVIWVGWSLVAVGVAAGLYAVHMFAITGFYHRYFSHRT
ncbi:MAG: hypothetical protein IID37_10555, partial [Planctomycetes bacterium]|nr:hypothetical protein [Planctomycetota bacterium]